MKSHKLTSGPRTTRYGRAVLAILALGVASPRPAAAVTVAGAAAPSMYWTEMPRVDSLMADTPVYFAIKYKRVAQQFHTLKVYQGQQLIYQTTANLGNNPHDGAYFTTYADKTGYYWAWFGKMTLGMMGAYGYSEARQTQPIYFEVCYANPSGMDCRKSAAYNYDVRQPYPFVAGDWAARLASGPRDKSRKWTPPADKHVGGYYTDWSTYSRNYQPKDIPVEALTHVYHAFLGVCSETYNQKALGIENDNISKGIDGRPYTAMKNSCAAAQAKEFEVAMSDPFADVQKTGFDASEKRDITVLCPTGVHCLWTSEPFAGIYAEYYRMKAALAAQGKSTKILISIGGFSLSDPFFELAKTAAGRETFVDSVTRFLTKYDVFDGVDIDWEFPGDPDNPTVSNEAADKVNNVALMSLLRQRLKELTKVTGKKYELTMAVGPSIVKHVYKLDMASLNKYVDRMNLMTYDYYGTWNGSTTFGHHAGFNFCSNGLNLQPNQFSYGLLTLSGAAQDVDRTKLSVGVASYGYGWRNVNGGPAGPTVSPAAYHITGDAAAFGIDDFRHYVSADGNVAFKGIEKFQIGLGAPLIASYGQYLWGPSIQATFGPGPNGTGPGRLTDPGCNSPTEFLWMRESNQGKGAFITYDSPGAVGAKATYVKENGYGGVFMWELATDSGTLLNAMNYGIGSTQQ